MGYGLGRGSGHGDTSEAAKQAGIILLHPLPHHTHTTALALTTSITIQLAKQGHLRKTIQHRRRDNDGHTWIMDRHTHTHSPPITTT